MDGSLARIFHTLSTLRNECLQATKEYAGPGNLTGITVWVYLDRSAGKILGREVLGANLIDTTNWRLDSFAVTAKKKQRRKEGQPVIPQVATETWQALSREADAFAKLEPWDWMWDDQILGLRDPKTGEKLLCSILGALQQVHGLLVFRNQAGHRFLLTTVLEDNPDQMLADRNRGFDRDLLQVEFVSKAELTSVDRRVFSSIGFSPSKSRGGRWPLFRSSFPGCYPWYLTQAEAEILLYVLPYVRAFSIYLRELAQPNIGVLESGIAFLVEDYDTTKRPMNAGDLKWETMLPPPAMPAEPIVIDSVTLESLRQLPQDTECELELDVSYLAFPCMAPDRPYFPNAALAIERDSGIICAHSCSDNTDRQGKNALSSAFVSALKKLHCRPGAIYVQHQRVADALKSATSELDIELIIDPQLLLLNSVREIFEQSLRA
ncbi:MAG TPA: hypothetical protein PLW35_04095 [Verrucomicrobiota bacterium]|nr:hypothetical protein [Verrucomicrobiota bacterium]